MLFPLGREEVLFRLAGIDLEAETSTSAILVMMQGCSSLLHDVRRLKGEKGIDKKLSCVLLVRTTFHFP